MILTLTPLHSQSLFPRHGVSREGYGYWVVRPRSNCIQATRNIYCSYLAGDIISLLLLAPHYHIRSVLPCWSAVFNDISGHDPHPVLLMSMGILLLSEIGITVRYFMGYSMVLILLGRHKAHERSWARSWSPSHEFFFLGIGLYTAQTIFALECLL